MIFLGFHSYLFKQKSFNSRKNGILRLENLREEHSLHLPCSSMLHVSLIRIFKPFQPENQRASETSASFVAEVFKAKTYEAHCDLSVQLAAGFLERDYSVLVHGWAINRNITAQLYWRCHGNRDNLELNGMAAFHKSFVVGSMTLPLLLYSWFTGKL